MNELVFKGENGQAVTTSQLIAETFGKEHRRVMQDIRELGCSQFFREHNFVLSFIIKEIPNGGSKKIPFYTVSKDGFTILAMSYTGELAMKFKEEYISAFNRMEAELRNSIRPDLTGITRKNLARMLLESETEIERMREESEEKERKLSYLKERLDFVGDVRERIDRVEYLLLKALEPSCREKREKKEKQAIASRTYRRSEFQQTIESRSPGAMLVSRMCRKMRADDPLLNFKTKAFFEWLRSKGYLLSTPDKFNLPSEECMKNGYMIYSPSGTMANGVKYYTPYVTMKGYAFFYETVKKEGGLL